MESRAALEGMQDDALQQATQRDVEVFGKRLEYFKHVFFDTPTGLYVLDVQWAV